MKLYRYYDIQYSAGYDECGDCLGPGRVGVHLMEFEVVKETKCGAWIALNNYLAAPDETIPKEYQRFVNLRANKKYACLTKEDALVSFVARKRRQIKILSAQVKRAEKALAVAKVLVEEQNV